VGAFRGEEIQVVALDLEPPSALLAGLAALLSDAERDRAARFRFEHDRRRFVAARGGLRSILGACVGADPERIDFTYGPQGKPALAGRFGPAGVHFNASHSADLGLVALSRGREVGVDLERVRPLSDAVAIARRFFSAGETEALLSLPEHARERAFFDCWARKEAFIKATGEGLGRALDSFDVSLRPGELARIERVAGEPGEADQWTLLNLAPAPGFAAALASRGPITTVSCGFWAFPSHEKAARAFSACTQAILEAR